MAALKKDHTLPLYHKICWCPLNERDIKQAEKDIKMTLGAAVEGEEDKGRKR